MADLRTGEVRTTRTGLHDLLDTLEPVAAQLTAACSFARARELVEVNGAIAQRRIAREAGIPAVAGWLASQFVEAPPG
jgi:gamma-glutamyl:cysteine ligase YbdK (ATP-grasp superfamily)